MVWLTRETACAGYPVQLDHVYVTTRGNRRIGNSVWPQVGDGTRCAAVQRGAVVSWPGLPVQGAVVSGTPPGGDYVPSATVGEHYRSPGYATAASTGPGGGGGGGEASGRRGQRRRCSSRSRSDCRCSECDARAGDAAGDRRRRPDRAVRGVSAYWSPTVTSAPNVSASAGSPGRPIPIHHWLRIE